MPRKPGFEFQKLQRSKEAYPIDDPGTSKEAATEDDEHKGRRRHGPILTIDRKNIVERRQKTGNKRTRNNKQRLANKRFPNDNLTKEKIKSPDPVEARNASIRAKQWVDSICKKGVAAVIEEFGWCAQYPPNEEITEFYKYKALNRNDDILLLDKTRIVLKEHKIFDDEREYIHASYVDGVNGGHNFVCAQGPTEKTTGDFWAMVWQEDVSCIVMLTDIYEQGQKCVRYYPDMNHIRNFMLFSEFMVTRAGDTRNQDLGAGHMGKLTELELIRCGCAPRTVHHLQYKDWESEMAPKDSRPILNLINISSELSAGNATLVHSSAGTGRAGVYILIDMCLNEMNSGQLLDITAALKRLRSQRAYAVANEKQYAAVYRALLEHAINKYNVPITEELRLFAKELNDLTK